MTTVSLGAPFTRSDLDALPDDGRRHELIDGVLVMTPAPSPRHQLIQMELIKRLLPAIPTGQRLLAAPLDVVLGPATVLQPDLLIAARTALTSRDLPVAPLLAIEVLSPSTRRLDLGIKRALYESGGCAAYWVIDPDEPSITAWELHEGRYAEVGRAVGSESLRLHMPVEVEIVPADLVT
ncbi:Uma2 family endonuclease [Nostocoides vanveenii]